MKATSFRSSAMISMVVAMAVLASGCGQQASEPAGDSTTAASHDDHDHGGWWCVEHGVPEDDCSMCSSTAATAFKAQDDWCEEHGRADSQCFICHPEQEVKFAKLYEAKFGEEPPKPTEN